MYIFTLLYLFYILIRALISAQPARTTKMLPTKAEPPEIKAMQIYMEWAKTVPTRESFKEYCEEDIKYCLRGYATGLVCARTINFHYKTFDHYCAMEFMNCLQRFEMWHVFHMGACEEVPELTAFRHYELYEFDDDSFMDQTYVYEYDI